MYIVRYYVLSTMKVSQYSSPSLCAMIIGLYGYNLYFCCSIWKYFGTISIIKQIKRKYNEFLNAFNDNIFLCVSGREKVNKSKS